MRTPSSPSLPLPPLSLHLLLPHLIQPSPHLMRQLHRQLLIAEPLQITPLACDFPPEKNQRPVGRLAVPGWFEVAEFLERKEVY